MTTTLPIGSAPENLLLSIANPLTGTNVPLPIEIVREGTHLLWRRNDDGTAPLDDWNGFVEGESAENALWEFQRLSKASDDEIEAFARRYGVLGIRADGHPGTDPQIEGGMNLLPPFEMRDGAHWHIEDTRVWRAFAEGMRGMIAFALALHESEFVDPEKIIQDHDLINDWGVFGIPHSEENHPHFIYWLTRLSPRFIAHNLERVGSEFMRTYLAYHLSSNWIPSAALAPVLRWEQGRPYMHLSLGGSTRNILPENALFSVLVAQMAALVISAGMDRVARCEICGDMFEPLVKPGRHERSFCSRHKLEGKRERKREWARKKAAERRAAQESS